MKLRRLAAFTLAMLMFMAIASAESLGPEWAMPPIQAMSPNSGRFSLESVVVLVRLRRQPVLEISSIGQIHVTSYGQVTNVQICAVVPRCRIPRLRG